MDAAQTYDELAEHYHLIFEDWDKSIQRQAAVLDSILRQKCGIRPPARLLDCACGIGTQSLGLAKLGFQLTGCDVSGRAIGRAREEAAARNLKIDFLRSDMLALEELATPPFDAVLCIDNALPHLQDEEQLMKAAQQMRARLHPGGWLVASIRDYDRLVVEKPAAQSPAFYLDGGHRRIVFQLWDWIDSRRYIFHLYITLETDQGWQTFHTAGAYRPILREELSNTLRQTGFKNVCWMLPDHTGFYQPIVIAQVG